MNKYILFSCKILIVSTIFSACNSTPIDESDNKLSIKVAGYDYDRVKAIQSGKAGIEGVHLDFEVSNIYALNKNVFGTEQSYVISEIGLIPYISRYINEGFRDYTLVPVFISRVFRHKNIFVHADAGINKPQDLIGKKVGTPGYGMSSHTWIRGLLLD